MAELISKAQSIKLHTLLSQLNLMEHKPGIISEFTEGRTTSARELYKNEAQYLIGQLMQQFPAEKLKRAIWGVAYKAGMIYGDTKDDYKMNAAKIDAFLRERGVVKKPLQKMNYEELKQVHKQFEGILKNNNRTADNKAAQQATKQLLNELNISTTK